MSKFRFMLNAFSVLVILFAGFSLAQAQATRTWVSGVGDDANPCSRTAPCKTFAGAISKTAAGGEIDALDPGGFGAVTITKSITINGTGTLGSILVSGTNGININAGANDVITLRNLQITGVGNGLNGINYIAGKQVIVEDCDIQGFQTGILVNLMASGTLNVKNVTITPITSGGVINSSVGIRLTTNNGFVVASLDGLTVTGMNDYGIQTQMGAFVTLTNSTFRNINSTMTSAALETEDNSSIATNNITLNANRSAVQVNSSTSSVRLSNDNIFSNTTGLNNSGGGVITSFGNNRIFGNATNGTPTATIGQQ